MTEHPAWFTNAVVGVLQQLIVLSLPGTPASEVLPLTTRVWVDALWPTRSWVQQLDEPRLRAAVQRLAGAAERWPAPRDLLRELPPRAERPALPAKRTPPTPEQAAALRAAREALVRKAPRP